MKIALHGFGDRKTSLRNITVTVEESVDRWARLEAARRDISVSRLLASILKDRMQEEDVWAKAMRRPWRENHS
jgi:predicted HicB family RNase H-like nuclease